MNPFFLSQDFLSNLFTKVAAKLVTSLIPIQEGKFPHGSLIRFPHLLLQECSKNYIRLASLIQSGSLNIVLITNIGSIQNKWLLHVFHSLMYVTLTISPFKGRVGISVQFLFSLFLVCSSKKCWRGSWQLFSRQLSRRRHGQLDFVWRWVWSVIIPNAVKSCILWWSNSRFQIHQFHLCQKSFCQNILHYQHYCVQKRFECHICKMAIATFCICVTSESKYFEFNIELVFIFEIFS